MNKHWMTRGGKGLLFFALATLVFGGVVMLLWNALIPVLFHGPELNYWQAVGLLVLTKILFRGGGFMWRGKSHDHWRGRFEQKLAAMAPEDREKFKEEWKRRCGYVPEEHEKK